MTDHDMTALSHHFSLLLLPLLFLFVVPAVPYPLAYLGPKFLLVGIQRKDVSASGCAIIAKSMIFGNYDFDSGVCLKASNLTCLIHLVFKCLLHSRPGLNQGAGVLNLRETGLSGTWLPKAQTEDLGRRTGRRLSKEASQEWAQAIQIRLHI
jgi:hypothetical protein